MSKAPSGHNRHKYVCLQVNLQDHILCSVGAKHPFDTLILLDKKAVCAENATNQPVSGSLAADVLGMGINNEKRN